MFKNHRLWFLTVLSCLLIVAAILVGVYSSWQKKTQRQIAQIMSQALKSPPDEAERILRKAANLRPNDPLVQFVFGEALNLNDKSDEALKVWERALEIAKKRNDSEMLQRRIQNALARLYEDLGEYDKAIALYKENMVSGPMELRQRFTRIRLGDLYRKKGDFASAAREYGVAIRAGAASNRPEVFFSAALCEARSGNPEMAYRYLTDLFEHPLLIGVRPGDGQANALFRNWIEVAKNGSIMSEVRSIKGFKEAIARAQKRAESREACTRIYQFPITVPGFRREFPTSAEMARTYARYAGFSRDLLLACANDDFVNADFEVGDERRFGYGFGACYYYFQTRDQASEGIRMLQKLSLPQADWKQMKWRNHSLTNGTIGDETWSADDGCGNIRLIVRKSNFLAVLYCGEFDRLRGENVPPNVPGAMDAVARQIAKVAL